MEDIRVGWGVSMWTIRGIEVVFLLHGLNDFLERQFLIHVQALDLALVHRPVLFSGISNWLDTFGCMATGREEIIGVLNCRCLADLTTIFSVRSHVEVLTFTCAIARLRSLHASGGEAFPVELASCAKFGGWLMCGIYLCLCYTID